MSSPTAPDDPTLALWRAEQEKKDREKADKQERQARQTELEGAFIAVRFGMPEAGNDEQSAVAFGARWGHIVRLVTKSPDLVHRRLDQVKAEGDSYKGYALRFVTTAAGNEADAVKLLLDSWQASTDAHGGVMYWLTRGLEAEIMGWYGEAILSEPLPDQDPSGAEQSPPAIVVEVPSNPIPVTPTQVGESMEWTTADGPSQWARMFDVSLTTFRRRLKDGSIRHKKLSTKSYQIAIADLPAKHQAKYRSAEKPNPK
jgi:hypothetical protein